MSEPPPGEVTVLVVDDEELTRTGLRALLAAQPDLSVVGEAADGTEVLPLVTRLRPDVVLMDVRMPGIDGIEATRRLRAELPDPPKVVIITTFENDEYVWDALLAGAGGFIRKRAPTSQIAHAIRLMAEGLSNQEISRRLTIALETVKTHVGNVLAKLNANNRTHAVVLAYEAGALSLD